MALHIDGVTTQSIERTARRHGEKVLGMANGLLAEAGLSLVGLDALAFGRGPGSFTGVRIAAAVVQGAAYAAQLPVVPVSNLAAMALGAYRMSGRCQTLVAVDARMNQVYWGAYRLEGGESARLEGEEAVLAPEQVPHPSGTGWIGAGSGWEAYGGILGTRLGDQVIATLPDLICEAQYIAELAARLFLQGEAVPAEAAMPVYLRDQVAFKTRGRNLRGRNLHS